LQASSNKRERLLDEACKLLTERLCTLDVAQFFLDIV
jgi:hypothetical protein